MDISLIQFLASGKVGIVGLGSNRQDIQNAYGDPIDFAPGELGGSSEVWKYGCVEFYIKVVDGVCHSVFIESNGNPPMFTWMSSWIVIDWELQAGTSRNDTKKYLKSLGYDVIRTDYGEYTTGLINISFADTKGIYAIVANA